MIPCKVILQRPKTGSFLEFADEIPNGVFGNKHEMNRISDAIEEVNIGWQVRRIVVAKKYVEHDDGGLI